MSRQVLSLLLLGVGCFASCASAPQQVAPDKPKSVAVKPTTNPEQVKKSFNSAVDAYQLQKKSKKIDYDNLLERFEGILRLDPKMAEAHYNLGCIYEAMLEDQKALEHYRKALALKPELTLASAGWGGILVRRGKLDQALTLYQKAIGEASNNSPVLLNMASIYKQQKKFNLAISRASEVLMRDPTNLGAYRVMAAVYFDMGKLDMARLICLRGLKIKTIDPGLQNTLGLVLLKMGSVPEALVRFRAALKQQPDMLPTRFNIAKVALDYKDFKVARKEFSKILEYNPNNKMAGLGLGIALRGMGEFGPAKIRFEKMAKKYPKDPVLQQWICRLDMRSFNDSRTARKSCGKCIQLQKEKPNKNHPCVAMYNEAVQEIKMEKKMKAMELKARDEQKKLDAKMARLAQMRKNTVDKAWAWAKENCGVLPPKKLAGEKLEFVLNPLAVLPSKATKVKLVGAIFDGVKRINVGTVRVKWEKINQHTLEMSIPKGLQAGPWDVLVTFKDGSELFFGGGLWVGMQPKCKSAPAGSRKSLKKGRLQKGRSKQAA
jgi:tetratricopeptide (TPR) repeat protein